MKTSQTLPERSDSPLTTKTSPRDLEEYVFDAYCQMSPASGSLPSNLGMEMPFKVPSRVVPPLFCAIASARSLTESSSLFAGKTRPDRK